MLLRRLGGCGHRSRVKSSTSSLRQRTRGRIVAKLYLGHCSEPAKRIECEKSIMGYLYVLGGGADRGRRARESETPGQFHADARTPHESARAHLRPALAKPKTEHTTRYRDEAANAQSRSEAGGSSRIVQRARRSPSAKHIKGEQSPSNEAKHAY